ncbi:Uncharacterised protein [Candidatus Gugararchaeum adminiculabundum]|nr:Uncharacterised protein [Candidatus Gugararchaeum adminiculabundum]
MKASELLQRPLINEIYIEKAIPKYLLDRLKTQIEIGLHNKSKVSLIRDAEELSLFSGAKLYALVDYCLCGGTCRIHDQPFTPWLLLRDENLKYAKEISKVRANLADFGACAHQLLFDKKPVSENTQFFSELGKISGVNADFGWDFFFSTPPLNDQNECLPRDYSIARITRERIVVEEPEFLSRISINPHQQVTFDYTAKTARSGKETDLVEILEKGFCRVELPK